MLEKYLKIAVDASYNAGKEILKIYNLNFKVFEKEDKSPLTEADIKSNEIINSYLKKTNLPILSEENKKIPYKERKNWQLFWLVDPLDGTKEFIKKNGEFTVNIALVENKRPVLGVIYAPALKVLYYAVKNKGSYKIFKEKKYKLPLVGKSDNIIKVIASKSHINEKTKNLIQSIKGKKEILNVGSSLKFCILAEGKAHIYPRVAPTMEWDTAAGQIILEETGGKVLNLETKKSLFYNKPSLINPEFIALTKGYDF